MREARNGFQGLVKVIDVCSSENGENRSVIVVYAQKLFLAFPPCCDRSSLRFESGNGGNGNVLPRSDGFSSFYLAQTARNRRVANVSHYRTDEIRIRPIALLLMHLSPLSRSFFSFLRKSWTSVPPSRRGFTVDDFPLFSTLSLVMS